MKVNDCIIVDKETIEIAISQLREQQRNVEIFNKAQRAYYEGSIAALSGVLSEAQPLFPVLEKAFDEGSETAQDNVWGEAQGWDVDSIENYKQKYLTETDL